MKIVHLTDLHVETRPRARDLLGKRLIGSVNLYLLGRHAKFNPQVQAAAVQAAVDQDPDVVVITGDLTAQALQSEFQAARQLLDPILSRFPTVLLAGNHDTYVRESTPAARMRRTFGDWMGERSPWLHVHGDVGFLSIETCRAHPLSSGRVPRGELDEAQHLLDEHAGDRFVFLCQHYPLRGRSGQPYGPRSRALSNAHEVEALLCRTDRVHAVLHGHEHHGFRTTIETAGGPVPILNPGASGYSLMADMDRTAHFNVYSVEGGALRGVERFRYTDQGFEPEPGGAYASGR